MYDSEARLIQLKEFEIHINEPKYEENFDYK